MQAVYEAENSIDAHLARVWLEQAGLSPWIRGEFLGGALGELPAHGVLAVCVPVHQVPAARQALEELQRVRCGEQAPQAAVEDEDEDPGASEDDGWMRA